MVTKCLNCPKDAYGEDRYCSGKCYYEHAGFTYKPPIQPRFVIKNRHPSPICDCGQGPTPWLYDTKEQEYVRKAIMV